MINQTMKIYLTTFIVLSVLLTACYGNSYREQKAIEYDEEQTAIQPNIDSLLSDSSKILRAEFPLRFDSTRILIHPVGFVNVLDAKATSRYDKKYRDYDEYQMMISTDQNNIKENITYLVFEDMDNNTIRPLTKKVLNISNIQYLRALAYKKNVHYLLYKVQDKDTNRDSKINKDDITSLYISRLNGADFKKISSDYQQLEGGEWEYLANRYYFRTMEDVNKDGKFNKKDKYHYFYIDFSSEPYKVVEYDLLKDVLK